MPTNIIVFGPHATIDATQTLTTPVTTTKMKTTQTTTTAQLQQ